MSLLQLADGRVVRVEGYVEVSQDELVQELTDLQNKENDLRAFITPKDNAGDAPAADQGQPAPDPAQAAPAAPADPAQAPAAPVDQTQPVGDPNAVAPAPADPNQVAAAPADPAVPPLQ